MDELGIAQVAEMYPVDGLDWVELMVDPGAFRRYRERVEPLLAEDFEVLPVQPAGELSTVIVGVEAYLAGMRVVMEAFERFCITPERFVPIDGGILVFARLEGMTIEGPHRFEGEGGAIFELRDGLIARLREFDDRERLLDAGGLTAQEAERLGTPAHVLRTA
ncbi:MAG: nuclear transport factor 2 family protein [Solirubrobacterales bacterium]